MKFFFYEYGSSRYFYQVLWQFFNSELRFIFSDRFFRFLATTPSLLALSLSKGSRGEMDSNCFKNTEQNGTERHGKCRFVVLRLDYFMVPKFKSILGVTRDGVH